MRSGSSQKEAAAHARVPVKTFRHFLRSNRLAKYKGGGRWQFTDRRPRAVVAITTRGDKEITVRGYNKASLVMQHREAVRRFRDTNDLSHLTPFEGRTVTDKSGRNHALETRPNVLLRRAATGGEPYEQVYKLTA
jgi:hypothetical protein